MAKQHRGYGDRHMKPSVAVEAASLLEMQGNPAVEATLSAWNS